MLLKSVFLLFIIILTASCDLVRPSKTFTLAVPEKDYSYNYSAGHLKSFLEKYGYTVRLLPAENAIEANRMVAEGTADLTFIMNHSVFIPGELEGSAANLRSILPLFSRLFFLFAKEWEGNASIREHFAGKSVGIEVLDGESHTNLAKMLGDGRIDSVEIVEAASDPDIIHFWGTYYGERVNNLLAEGWQEVSIEDTWIEFITLNEPALEPFVLPAIPGIETSREVHTVAAETLLVGNKNLGENTVFELVKFILQHKLELMSYDRMYQSIDESFASHDLLYPLHPGTDAFMRRNEPGFLERYADAIALVLSVGAILYGSFQAIKARRQRNKKVRIDNYFLEFLDIKGNTRLDYVEKMNELDELIKRSLVQMAEEKLDKADFHIFSRLVQQEQTNMRQVMEKE